VDKWRASGVLFNRGGRLREIRHYSKGLARKEAFETLPVWKTDLKGQTDVSLVHAPSLDEPRNIDADTVPMALKITAIFLAASGTMALVSGLAGSHGWPSLGRDAESPGAPQLGNWNFVYAVLVTSLSIGIWRRRPWAWWGGFLLLGLSVCWPLFAMPAHAELGLPTGIKVVFAVFSCLVVAIWGRWWYAQRMHFIWS
jgi:hypothetical protein